MSLLPACQPAASQPSLRLQPSGLVSAVVLAVFVMLPVVSLCCLLTCTTFAHETEAEASASHCDDAAPDASDPAVAFATGSACFANVAVVSAEFTRPYTTSPDAVAVSTFTGLSSDVRIAARGSAASSRIPPRGSPLHTVLRI